MLVLPLVFLAMDLVPIEMFDALDDPWREKGRSIHAGLTADVPFLHWDELVCCAGNVMMVKNDILRLGLCPFECGSGFVSDKDPVSFTVRIPDLPQRSMPLPIGSKILCAGTADIDLADTRINYTKDVAVMHFPELLQEMPWNSMHLFAGAFNGWSQAERWIANANLGITFASEVFVDNSEDIMRLWSVKHSKAFLTPPFRPSTTKAFEQTIGLLTSVADFSLLHHLHAASNLIFTLSPPCVSWSKAGLRRGLHCPEGWAFIDSLGLIAASQPIALAIECAEDLPSHKHAVVIYRLLRALGYRNVWDQIVDSHHLTHANRTRWLSVWVRACDDSKAFSPIFQLKAHQRVAWHDLVYRFLLPPSIMHQLRLTPSELEIYGNLTFLPPAKRAKLVDFSVQNVLKARFPGLDEPLPTLCAHYSNQHMLSRDHLSNRGIFAALLDGDQGIQFIEPTRWISLLGAVESVVVPTKVECAFFVLGNAVSVPHAVLTLLVAFSSMARLDVNIHDLVRQCWDSRLTTANSFVVIDDEMMWIKTVEDFRMDLKIDRIVPLPVGICKLCVRPLNRDTSMTLFIPDDWHPVRLLLALDLLPSHLRTFASFWSGPVQAKPDSSLGMMRQLDSKWIFFLANHSMVTLEFLEWTFDDSIPPTERISLDTTEHDLPSSVVSFDISSWNFDALVAHPTYSRLLKVLETSICETSRSTDRFRQTLVALHDVQTVAQVQLQTDSSLEYVHDLCRVLYPDICLTLHVPAVPLSSCDLDLVLPVSAPASDTVSVLIEHHRGHFLSVCDLPLVLPVDVTFVRDNVFFQIKLHNASSPTLTSTCFWSMLMCWYFSQIPTKIKLLRVDTLLRFRPPFCQRVLRSLKGVSSRSIPMVGLRLMSLPMPSTSSSGIDPSLLCFVVLLCGAPRRTS